MYVSCFAPCYEETRPLIYLFTLLALLLLPVPPIAPHLTRDSLIAFHLSTLAWSPNNCSFTT